MSTKPDYAERSIVNLSSGIAEYLGHEPLYTPLQIQGKSLLDYGKSVLLLVLDGLGYNYLQRHVSEGSLDTHLSDCLTSVFPASTGSAITSIFTATAPLQHGITGWFVYLKELGMVSRFLPFTPLTDYRPLNVEISRFVGAPPILDNPGVSSVVLQSDHIIDSKFSVHMCGDAQRIGFQSLGALFDSLAFHLAKFEKRFVYAYWDGLDSRAHEYGCEHSRTLKHLELIDEKFTNFINNIPKNVLVLVTADHGFVDATPETLIHTSDHPELMETLIMPVCGDTRVGYCYVRPSRTEEFEEYVHTNLSHACTLLRSCDMVDEGWLGLFDPGAGFESRVGDYVLLMKDNYALLNTLPGRRRVEIVGHHGGTSEDEMKVPLIVFES
jgi:hypothetical protein